MKRERSWPPILLWEIASCSFLNKFLLQGPQPKSRRSILHAPRPGKCESITDMHTNTSKSKFSPLRRTPEATRGSNGWFSSNITHPRCSKEGFSVKLDYTYNRLNNHLCMVPTNKMFWAYLIIVGNWKKILNNLTSIFFNAIWIYYGHY